MTLLSRLAALMVVLVLGASPAANAQDPSVEWLMVVQGTVAEVSADELTLTVPSSAIVFSDRPERLVRLINLGDFVSGAWGPSGDLRADPPNASLVNESEGNLAVVEITEATVVDGLLALHLSVLEGTLPGTGAEIAITIDAFPTSVNDQITDLVGNGGDGGAGGV